MKKIFSFGVILLFIGVAVAPSITLSVVKASDDNDPVEVTTEQYQDFPELNDNETKRHIRLLSFVVFIFWLRLGRSYWFEDHSTIWIRNNQYIIHPLLWLRGQWMYLKAWMWVAFWATLSNIFVWNWDALDFFPHVNLKTLDYKDTI
jgi:hypothetical protein